MRRLLLTLSICMILIPATTLAQDTDNDGVVDSVDNCPTYWNPEQYDADEDGIGNVCDECTDQDSDGYGDPGFPTNTCPEDNCPGFYNPDQLDTDSDGVGDLCEGLECGDMDGDGTSGFLFDVLLGTEYIWTGGPAPVSTYAANSDGCGGFDAHDLIYSFSYFGPQLLKCGDTSSCEPAQLGHVTVDSVAGLMAPDTLSSGSVVRFYIRIATPTTISGISMGFHVYSSTLAKWTSTTISQVLYLGDHDTHSDGFDLVRSVRSTGVTGSNADTLTLGYMTLFSNGLPTGFDSVTHVISIGPILSENLPGEICLDSCWYPPGGTWTWGRYFEKSLFIPSWDGPHCFTIVRCCEPRGDIDNSGSDPDIADLIYLVSYMFQDGPAPVCPEKADINGDSVGPDIADLVYLVTFMFQDGPPPAPCE